MKHLEIYLKVPCKNMHPSRAESTVELLLCAETNFLNLAEVVYIASAASGRERQREIPDMCGIYGVVRVCMHFLWKNRKKGRSKNRKNTS